jgi:hypothetical protein
MSEPVTVRCTIVEERELALQIEQSHARGGTLRVWVPRSQLEHIAKRQGAMNSSITMPEWLAEAKGLDFE